MDVFGNISGASSVISQAVAVTHICVGVHQQVERARLAQDGQERDTSGDLPDDVSDFALDLLHRFAWWFRAGVVAVSIKRFGEAGKELQGRSCFHVTT